MQWSALIQLNSGWKPRTPVNWIQREENHETCAIVNTGEMQPKGRGFLQVARSGNINSMQRNGNTQRRHSPFRHMFVRWMPLCRSLESTNTGKHTRHDAICSASCIFERTCETRCISRRPARVHCVSGVHFTGVGIHAAPVGRSTCWLRGGRYPEYRMNRRALLMLPAHLALPSSGSRSDMISYGHT